MVTIEALIPGVEWLSITIGILLLRHKADVLAEGDVEKTITPST